MVEIESDIDEEDAKKIVETVLKVIDALAETPDPENALRVLSGVSAFIICNGWTSAQAADGAKRVFLHAVSTAIDQAETAGATSWTRGTVH